VKEMTEGAGVPPFLEGVGLPTDGASLNPKNQGFEDQIEAFPYSF
jgi:hypothetical protein